MGGQTVAHKRIDVLADCREAMLGARLTSAGQPRRQLRAGVAQG